MVYRGSIKPTEPSAPESAQAAHDRVSAEVERLIKGFYQSVAAHDTSAMREALTAGFELTEPQRQVRWSRDDFIAQVAAFQAQGSVEYRLDQFFTEEHQGEIAYSGYRNRLRFLPAQGDPMSDQTIEFAVVVRDGDAWKIDRIHGFVVPFQDD